MPTTWNSSDITAGMSLSSGDTVVTLNNSSAVTLVRATTGKTSGKWYFKVIQSASGSGDSMGVALLSMTGTNVFSNTILHGAGIWGLGALNINGTTVINSNIDMSVDNGSAIEFAVDLDNWEIWSRKSPSSLWNHDAAANPATNTGGKSISAFSGQTLYPYACWQNGTGTGRTATIDTSVDSGTPSGFDPWESSAIRVNRVSRKLLVSTIPGANTFGPIPVFPTLPESFPVKVTPVWDTVIGTTKSLRETRVALQTYPLWDIELLFEELRDETQNQDPYVPFIGYQQYMDLVENWLMMYGQTGVFALDCPWDNSRTDQFIGVGDGTSYVFNMWRTWGQGATATIAPVGLVNAVFNVKLNGTTVDPSQYQIVKNQLCFIGTNGATYLPSAGVFITATFSYYYLCRFVEDEQDFEEFAKNRWIVSSLKMRATLWLDYANPYNPLPDPPPSPFVPTGVPGPLTAGIKVGTTYFFGGQAGTGAFSASAVVTTTDLATFTPNSCPIGYVTGLASNGTGTIIAYGFDTPFANSVLYRSTDGGDNWVQDTLPANWYQQGFSFPPIIYDAGLGLFVLVGWDISGGFSPQIATSTGNGTWTSRTAASTGSSSGLDAISLCGTLLIATSMGNASAPPNNHRLQTSTDAVTWTQRTTGGANGWINGAAAYNGSNLFVVVGFDQDTETASSWTSTNGTTGWTLHEGVLSDQANSLCFGAGVFFAGGTLGGGAEGWTSTDGETWTHQTFTQLVSFCFYDGSQFFAVGGDVVSAGVIYTSTDAETWTQVL